MQNAFNGHNDNSARIYCIGNACMHVYGCGEGSCIYIVSLYECMHYLCFTDLD